MTIKKLVSVDNKEEVTSARFLEIPIKGPGRKNLLIMINGVAYPNVDPEEAFRGVDVEVDIETQYVLHETDQLDIDRDVSAYVGLASVYHDYDQGSNTAGFRLATVEVYLKAKRLVQLNVTGYLYGDVGLIGIGYQVNVLVSRRR